MAERDRTSLNQFLATAIAERLGADDLYNRMVQKLTQTQFYFNYTSMQMANTSFHQIISSSNRDYLPLDLSEITNKFTRKLAQKVLSGKAHKKQNLREAQNG